MQTFEIVAIGIAIALFVGLFLFIGVVTLLLVCHDCPNQENCRNNKDRNFIPPCQSHNSMNNTQHPDNV